MKFTKEQTKKLVDYVNRDTKNQYKEASDLASIIDSMSPSKK